MTEKKQIPNKAVPLLPLLAFATLALFSPPCFALLNPNNLVYHTHAGPNLLSNGSIELGLGAEPIYPAWIQADPAEQLDIPDLPAIDPTTAGTGSQSLKISNVAGTNLALRFEFAPPIVADTNNASYYFSFYAKASRSGVTLKTLIDGGSRQSNIGTSWQHFEQSITRSGTYPQIQVEIKQTDGNPAPFTFWIDGICLSRTSQSSWQRCDPVEIALLPSPRNGIKFANQDVLLHWAANADTSRNISLELHLRDLSDNTAPFTLPWTTNLTLSSSVSSGTINLGQLPPGAYMALLGANDGSNNTLGVGVERFTVLRDLCQVPSPVRFVTGMHGGLRGYTMNGIGKCEFQWRGPWTPGEYYQTAYQIGLRCQRVDIVDLPSMEPRRRKYRFWFIEQDADAALSNNCQTYLTIDPATNLNTGDTPPTSGDGSWCYKEGVRPPDGDVHDPSWRRLYFPIRSDLQDLGEKLATSMKDRISVLELFNEINLFAQPEAIVDSLFEPFYKPFKKTAPAVCVLMNATQDYNADGSGYIDRFFQAGGGHYADGFSYHPYGRTTIEMQSAGIKFSKDNYQKALRWGENGQPLPLADSEEIVQGGGAFDGWEIMQRILLDWAAGCQWACSMNSDKLFFLEADQLGSWSHLHRGPRAPGRAAVAVNAMYSQLGGFERLGMADYGGDNSNDTLALFLQKPDHSEYAVAMACGNRANQRVSLDIDLSGIAYTLCDQWGRQIPTPSTPLAITREASYLKTTHADITNRFNNATVSWVADPSWYATELSPYGGSNPSSDWYAEYLRSAILPR